jgi:hypothetical protein
MLNKPTLICQIFAGNQLLGKNFSKVVTNRPSERTTL